MSYYVVIFLGVISLFSCNNLHASSLGEEIKFYEQVENLQKQYNIELNKIEILNLNSSLVNLSRSELEKKIPYSFSKKYILTDSSNDQSYVVVLSVLDKPSCVYVHLFKNKVVSTTVKFSSGSDFDEVLSKLKPIFGSKPRLSKLTNLKSADWGNKYTLSQLTAFSGKRLALLIKK